MRRLLAYAQLRRRWRSLRRHPADMDSYIDRNIRAHAARHGWK